MQNETPKKRAYSQAQNKATQRYIKNNYDTIVLRISKGRKAEIKAHADAQGESVNGFINRAIDETIERDKGEKSE